MPSPSTAPEGHLSDDALVAACTRGEESALGTLYDRYGGLLYTVAYGITGEAADAEEVVLDTLAQAWRQADRFSRKQGSVAAWLTTIARSRAIDLVRARGRRGRLADAALRQDAGIAPAMGNPPADPAEAVDHGERRRKVIAAMDTLGDDQRAVVELAFYQGMSHSEIAARLGAPLGTVKTRLRSAMHTLRGALRPYYFEAGT
jgi:RNA polymerase sigma-70 factor (ECF subfamily)